MDNHGGWGSGFRKKQPRGHRSKKNGVLCGAEVCGETEMPGVRSEGEDQRMEKMVAQRPWSTSVFLILGRWKIRPPFVSGDCIAIHKGYLDSIKKDGLGVSRVLGNQENVLLILDQSMKMQINKL